MRNQIVTRSLTVLLLASASVGVACSGEDAAAPGYSEVDDRQALPLSDLGVGEGGDGAERPTSDLDRAPAPTTRAPAPTNRPPRNIGQAVDESAQAARIETAEPEQEGDVDVELEREE